MAKVHESCFVALVQPWMLLPMVVPMQGVILVCFISTAKYDFLKIWFISSFQWRHNGRDSVLNHQPHDYLLNRLFRLRSKRTSKLRVTGDRWISEKKNFFLFDGVIMWQIMSDKNPKHPSCSVLSSGHLIRRGAPKTRKDWKWHCITLQKWFDFCL